MRATPDVVETNGGDLGDVHREEVVPVSTIQHDEERARQRLEEENRVLEGELQDLESQEQALERRTSTLEASGGLGAIFGVIALVVSIIAIIVALATKGTNTERVVT